MPMTYAILLIVVIGVMSGLIFIAGAYNRLVSLRNRYKNAYAQIDVQLKRRYDLIPNLVETAKGYLKHERGTLEEVISARNAASAANTKAAANPGEAGAMRELSGAETALAGSLGRLFAVAEAYPDLKANTLMGNLMEELTSTENRVSFARQAYNDSVMLYNTRCQVFPSNLVAGAFHFGPAEFLCLILRRTSCLRPSTFDFRQWTSLNARKKPVATPHGCSFTLPPAWRA